MLLLIAVACQKIREDTLAPQIELLGRNPDTLLLGCTYIDPGALVEDDFPGAYYYVSGEIDGDSAGTQYLEYTACDSDSNCTYASRRVEVVAYNLDFLIAEYAVIDTSYLPYTQKSYQTHISRVNEDSNIFKISNFNNFGDSFELRIVPDSTGTFTIDYNNADTTFLGSGHIKSNNTGLKLNYEEAVPGFFANHKAHYQKK
jgi:hypothetical protein